MSDDARERFVKLALDAVGLSMAPPEHRSARGAPPDARPSSEYLDLIAPGETEPRRTALGHVSGCALTVRGLMLRAGLRHARLDAAPELSWPSGRDAVLDVLCGPGWYRGASVTASPPPGDFVVYDPPRPHVGVVVPHNPLFAARRRPDSDRFLWISSVDGGMLEGEPPRQCIRHRATAFERDGDGWTSIRGALVAVVDFDAVWAAFGGGA